MEEKLEAALGPALSARVGVIGLRMRRFSGLPVEIQKSPHTETSLGTENVFFLVDVDDCGLTPRVDLTFPLDEKSNPPIPVSIYLALVLRGTLLSA